MDTSTPSFWGHADRYPVMAAAVAPLAGVLLSVMALWISAVPAPLHSVAIDISGRCGELAEQSPAVHTVVVDEDGGLSWDGQRLAGRSAIDARMQAIGAVNLPGQSVVHIRPHRLASYGAVTAVMASAQRHGVARIGVVGELSFMSDLRCAVCCE